MPKSLIPQGRFLVLAALPILGLGALLARAQPQDAEPDLSPAVEAHELRAAGLSRPRVMPDVAVAAECGEGKLLWPRAAGVALCATICTSDAVCGAGERCVVLDPSVAGDAEELPLIADVATEEELAAMRIDPEDGVEDEPPVCDEGDCGPYPGDLTVVVRPPLAVCDPFFGDAEGLRLASDGATSRE